jgi:hypothetical protein
MNNLLTNVKSLVKNTKSMTQTMTKKYNRTQNYKEKSTINASQPKKQRAHGESTRRVLVRFLLVNQSRPEPRIGSPALLVTNFFKP